MNRYLSPTLSIAFFAILLTVGGTLFSFKDQAQAMTQADNAPQQTDTSPPVETITIKGTGSASASADMAQVRLTIGGNDGFYGPSGPEFEPTDTDELALVVRVLEESGITPETIAVDAFSPSDFGPSSTTSTVRFLHTNPSELSRFLGDFLDMLKDEKGPKVSGAKVIFLVEDCAALEGMAMQSALNSARQRAEMMATQMDKAVSGIISVEEGGVTAFYGTASGGDCASLETAIHHTGFGAAGHGENSADEVAVSITLNATFTLE